MLWLHRRFVLQLGTAKFIQMIFENLTCIAGNCFDVLWVRQVTWIGTSHGSQSFMQAQSQKSKSFMHGIDGLFLSAYWIFANYVAFLDDSRWSGRWFFQWQTPIHILPLPSHWQLARHSPTQRSLVPILRRLHVLCRAMIFSFNHFHISCVVCTHTHIQFPSASKVRSVRDMGNHYNQTSAFQAPLYKSLLMRPPCLTFGRLKPWWMENFLCTKFNLVIPAFRWATNSSARFYRIIHLPSLVGIPFTRSRGPGIHCRCKLRCKTKSSNQQYLSPWSNIEYLLCIFQFFVHFLHQCMPIIVHQGCPSNNWTKHTVSHHLKFLKLIRSQRTGHKAKNNCGSDDGIKKFQTPLPPKSWLLAKSAVMLSGHVRRSDEHLELTQESNSQVFGSFCGGGAKQRRRSRWEPPDSESSQSLPARRQPL